MAADSAIADAMENTFPNKMEIKPIAYYRGSFGSKFGIPRQGTLVKELKGRIVFCESYGVQEALRGLEGFSHLWLIWGFSANKPAKGEWQPTVRPPRLGGNVAMGVWATRSPYRPNPLGLSCVALERIDGTELVISGADLMDGTPIYDIKPYIAYADSHPDARCGFAAEAPSARLQVVIPPELPLNSRQRRELEAALALDPRPAYQNIPDKEYAFPYDGADVRFTVKDGIVTVTEYKR